MSLTKLSQAGNNLIIPVQGELVSDIPAGDGKPANLFLQCIRMFLGFFYLYLWGIGVYSISVHFPLVYTCSTVPTSTVTDYIRHVLIL